MALRLQALPPIEDWSVAEVCDWLEVLGLEHLSPNFVAENISGRALMQIPTNTLRSQLNLTLGDSSIVEAEMAMQRTSSEQKRLPREPVVRTKGQLGVGEPLSPRTRERVRKYTALGKLRAEPLTDEELECWDDQSRWLRCAITGQHWLKDSQSLIGTALYHQPRFCSEPELQRRQLEEKHAARKKSEASSRVPDEQTSPSKKAALPSETPAEEDADADEWEVLGNSTRTSASKATLSKPATRGYPPQEDSVQDAGAGPVGRNNKGEVGVGNVYDRDFIVYPDVEPPAKTHLLPLAAHGTHNRLGWIEVMVGPVFERTAFNNGATGGSGTLGLQQRGIHCLDRQYNAVNFQFFVQRHANSFARKLCTSRLSFYIEEGHGRRVFPENILNQLSLLFYRTNDRLIQNGHVYQERVAECVMLAIPKILMQTVLEIVQGTGYAQYCEHAVRLYLMLHHTAIKLLDFFPQAHQRVYDKVKEWAQNPFSADATWNPEEAMLAASLVSVPFALLREALVRRVLHDMQGGANANMATLLKQNRELLERLTFVQSFFEAGPGRLSLHELEKKYTRCAGTLPRKEREQLMKAVTEASVDSLEDWWRMVGMDNVFSDDETCSRHLLALRAHVLASIFTWKVAVPKHEQRARTSALGAEELGASRVAQGAYVTARTRQQRKMAELEEAKKLHEGYPELVEGQLSNTTCLYCKQTFVSKGALFRHLRKMIPASRMITSWHQSHFCVTKDKLLSARECLKCPAKTCEHKKFADLKELDDHLVLMGVPGAAELANKSADVAAEEPVEENPADGTSVEDAAAQADNGTKVEEASNLDPYANMGKCFKCSSAREVVFAPCGHVFSCLKCASDLTTCPMCCERIEQKICVCWS